MELTLKLHDIGTMVRRSLLYTFRNIDNLMTMLFLPVAIMLLFVYVMGGAIQTGAVNYVTYVTPGILLLAIAHSSGTVAVSVNMDVKKGIVDRFKTMPIGPSTVLMGHAIASLIKNLISTALVLGVAFLIGFRPIASPVDWLGFLLIVTLYTLSITWLAIAFGLFTKTPEGASAFSFIVMFLPYLSSAFVPVESMPDWLRVFAENQPITPINESIRAFLLGGTVDGNLLAAILWSVGLILFGYNVSLLLFRKKNI